MFFEMLIGMMDNVVNMILDFLDLLPSIPASVVELLDNFLQIILGGVSLFFVFVDPTLFAIILPVFFIIHNAQLLYKIVLFILKKIPFINIK